MRGRGGSLIFALVLRRPLSDQFGWTPGAIGIAGTILTLGMFLTGPVVGKMLDRHGARTILVWSISLLALAMTAMSLMQASIALFFAGYGTIIVAGAGTTAVGYAGTVNGWFERRRGLALATMMIGSGVTAIVVPLFLAEIIPAHGWRAGYLACAAIVLLPLPVVLTLLKPAPVSDDRGGARAMAGTTAREALASRRFWALGAASFFVATALGSVAIHLVPILSENGLNYQTAVRTAAFLGAGLILGRVIAGLLLDKVNTPRVAILPMISTSAAIAMFLYGPAGWLPLAVILLGIGSGSEGDAIAYLTARLFGLAHFSELYGYLYGCVALGVATGPLLAALLLSLGGSYDLVLMIALLFCPMGASILWTIGSYPDREPLPA